MADSQIGIHLPSQLIEDVIRAEIVRALGDKSNLIEAVVSTALKAKDPRTYGSETIFRQEVNKMVREEAIQVVRQFIDSNRERIRNAFQEYLLRNSIIDKLVSGLIDRTFKVQLSLDVKTVPVKDGDEED